MSATQVFNVGEDMYPEVTVIDAATGAFKTDLAYNSAGFAVSAIVREGNGPPDDAVTIDLDESSGDHVFGTVNADHGRYTVKIPAESETAALENDTAPVDIDIVFKFTGDLAGLIGFTTVKVIDNAAPFGDAVPPVNAVQIKGSPPNDLDDGKLDVKVTEMDPAVLGEIQESLLTHLVPVAVVSVSSATASTVTFGAEASSEDGAYSDVEHLVMITSGPGHREWYRVTGYVGATRVATIDGVWTEQPTSSSKAMIFRFENAA